jgi:predicted transcriptional regulator
MPGSVPVSALTRVSPTLKDLFGYIYELSPLDMDLLMALIRNKIPMTSEELSSCQDRDKSNVFRSLQTLVSLGICNKETRVLRGGGIYHVYSLIPTPSFKKETERRVRELDESIRKILRRFEDEMEEIATTTTR